MTGKPFSLVCLFPPWQSVYRFSSWSIVLYDCVRVAYGLVIPCRPVPPLTASRTFPLVVSTGACVVAVASLRVLHYNFSIDVWKTSYSGVTRALSPMCWV